MKKKYVDQLDKHGREYVGLVTDGVKNMHTLISDLLEYSQVARSETGKELVDLNEIVNQVVQSLDSQISEADAEVEVAVLPHLEASRTAMTQLFQNLISNAIKFKQDGVDPRVKIEYWTEGKNHVFSVEDNGIGISPRYFEKVFMAFHRLHTKEKYQGTGIGLAICQKIVLNLNGKIWVESTPGQGSRFFFSLPVSQSGI
ncbi:MAG: ATP-binding protein [Bacteroidia bacterium]